MRLPPTSSITTAKRVKVNGTGSAVAPIEGKARREIGAGAGGWRVRRFEDVVYDSLDACCKYLRAGGEIRTCLPLHRTMPSPIKGLGLGMDELEQLVSSTFRDFDLYNPDLQLEQLLAPPSTFDDHEASRLNAETPVLDHPARPASRLASTTTLLRKVKSHASALLASRSGTPRPTKSQAAPSRERTKSASKPVFPFRRGSSSKELPPPVPPLPRTPETSIDQERTHLPYPTRTYTPLPAPDSPASVSSHGSPSSKPKRRRPLPSVFESDGSAARALFVDECEPPSVRDFYAVDRTAS